MQIQRSISESIDRLFEAFGATNAGKRSTIYRERLRSHSAATISRAVDRLIDRWTRTIAPPVNVVLDACREIEAEDRRMVRDRIAVQERGQRMNPQALEHCKMIAALFEAGFDFDDVLRKWVNADECAHIQPDDSRYQPVPFESTRAAHAALVAGRLGKGSERIIRFRKRSQIGRTLAQATGVTPQQASVFD